MTKKERNRRFRLFLMIQDTLFSIMTIQNEFDQMSDDWVKTADAREHIEALLKKYEDE